MCLIQLMGKKNISHRNFPQFFPHLMGETDRPHRAAFFPPVIDSNHPVRVFHHITVAVGINAGLVFFLHDNHIRRDAARFAPACISIADKGALQSDAHD